MLQKCYNLLVKRDCFMSKIIIASDHGGYNLKNEIVKHLKEQGLDIEDYGCYSLESCDYPIYAKLVAEEVAKGEAKGILVCGTGIGMSIAANKIKNIRASHCTDTYSAKMTRLHNDSNVLCLGERITGCGLAMDIVDIWLNTDFEGGRHKKRLDMI